MGMVHLHRLLDTALSSIFRLVSVRSPLLHTIVLALWSDLPCLDALRQRHTAYGGQKVRARVLHMYVLFPYHTPPSPYSERSVFRRMKFLRTLAFWHYMRDYFPIRLVKTVELPPDTTYLFAAFPHGFLAFGIVCNLGSNANHCDYLFPGLNPYLMTMVPNFDMPISRELLLWFGKRMFANF